MKTLKYKEWRNFNYVIEKCLVICRGNPDHLFKKTKAFRIIGSGAVRSIVDYELNEMDVELIKKMCAPSKPVSSFRIRSETIVISLLQKYFSSKNIICVFQYTIGAYRYDLKIGAHILFEYDENQHLGKTHKINDKRKDEWAQNNGYKVVRAQVKDDIVDIIIKINTAIFELSCISG